MGRLRGPIGWKQFQGKSPSSLETGDARPLASGQACESLQARDILVACLLSHEGLAAAHSRAFNSRCMNHRPARIWVIQHIFRHWKNVSFLGNGANGAA